MSDPLDGWEFTYSGSSIIHARREAAELHIYVERDGYVELEQDGGYSFAIHDCAELRAVLDELERRARDKWGDGWGLPPGTCPRCKGSGMIHSREIVTHVMRLDDPDFAPPQSGYSVDPCPECSTHEKAPAASSDRG